MTLLIRGGTLVDATGARPGELLVEGERIAAVGEHLDGAGAEVLDASGDLFTGFLERGVASVKLYMAYPERLMVDDAALERALAASRRTGVLVAVHAEDGEAVELRSNEMLAAGRRHPGWISEARPPWVEAEAIRRVGALALDAGAPVYVVHLSSGEGLAEVR